MNVKPYYTVTELAKKLGVSQKTVYRMLRRKGVALVPLCDDNKKRVVTLEALKTAMPEVFASFVMATRINEKINS